MGLRDLNRNRRNQDPNSVYVESLYRSIPFVINKKSYGRFMLFIFNKYVPSGGINDLKLVFDDENGLLTTLDSVVDDSFLDNGVFILLDSFYNAELRFESKKFTKDDCISTIVLMFRELIEKIKSFEEPSKIDGNNNVYGQGSVLGSKRLSVDEVRRIDNYSEGKLDTAPNELIESIDKEIIDKAIENYKLSDEFKFLKKRKIDRDRIIRAIFDKPVEEELTPNEIEEEEIPNKIAEEEISVEVEEVSIEEEIPTEVEEITTKIEEIPNEVEEEIPTEKEIPVEIEEISTDIEEEIPVEKEIPVEVEEEIPNEVKEEIPNKEEISVEVEEIPNEVEEEPSNSEPSNLEPSVIIEEPDINVEETNLTVEEPNKSEVEQLSELELIKNMIDSHSVLPNGTKETDILNSMGSIISSCFGQSLNTSVLELSPLLSKYLLNIHNNLFRHLVSDFNSNRIDVLKLRVDNLCNWMLYGLDVSFLDEECLDYTDYLSQIMNLFYCGVKYKDIVELHQSLVSKYDLLKLDLSATKKFKSLISFAKENAVINPEIVNSLFDIEVNSKDFDNLKNRKDLERIVKEEKEQLMEDLEEAKDSNVGFVEKDKSIDNSSVFSSSDVIKSETEFPSIELDERDLWFEEKMKPINGKLEELTKLINKLVEEKKV